MKLLILLLLVLGSFQSFATEVLTLTSEDPHVSESLRDLSDILTKENYLTEPLHITLVKKRFGKFYWQVKYTRSSTSRCDDGHLKIHYLWTGPDTYLAHHLAGIFQQMGLDMKIIAFSDSSKKQNNLLGKDISGVTVLGSTRPCE